MSFNSFIVSPTLRANLLVAYIAAFMFGSGLHLHASPVHEHELVAHHTHEVVAHFHYSTAHPSPGFYGEAISTVEHEHLIPQVQLIAVPVSSSRSTKQLQHTVAYFLNQPLHWLPELAFASLLAFPPETSPPPSLTRSSVSDRSPPTA